MPKIIPRNLNAIRYNRGVRIYFLLLLLTSCLGKPVRDFDNKDLKLNGEYIYGSYTVSIDSSYFYYSGMGCSFTGELSREENGISKIYIVNRVGCSWIPQEIEMDIDEVSGGLDIYSKDIPVNNIFYRK